MFGAIGEIDRLRGENADLRVALAGAEQRIAELTEAARENEELRELLGISRCARDGRPCRSGSSAATRRTSRGRSASTPAGTMACASGMPVVANANGAGALAGTVVSVTDDTARVRFIVDTRSVVIGLDQSSRALGEVRGQAGGQLVMGNIPVTDAVAVGDTIVSAGISTGEAASALSRRPPHRLRPGRRGRRECPDPDRVRAARRSTSAAERLLVVLAFEQG